MTAFLGVLIDGLSYGALIFLMAIGLSVTLGLMGFVNLAHTALAMVGGYFTVLFGERMGWPFGWAVLGAVAVATVLGVVLERSLFRLIYRRDALVQVLLTIGVMMMISAAMIYFFGPALQMVQIPEALRGRVSLGVLDASRYRLMLLGISLVLVVILQWGFERTRFGTMIRAAVDNQRVAAALGVPIQAVFMATFAVGTALAALGGALGVEALGLDPAFAMKNLILALLVVVVGGAGSIMGTFAASMMVAVFDIACKYYVPEIGAFAMYGLMLLLLMVRPQGIRGAKGASA
ncbi:MAG: branched-chain amino acid ABC transporter permease [Pigmentiphaga sp.]|uniref:branched-chain amino acid ABC transporter permease n=1 Tax=Pigmentiphaga sp. TaxID=1977564 RepID=UPI0029BDBAEC|nr:branched-chain amino acid ABC transporter permease [Pigmentiphaga sp.]MDX3905902.1 branched-chain amino acid ABC transporter permease [Pigmentiphaga sp.]